MDCQDLAMKTFGYPDVKTSDEAMKRAQVLIRLQSESMEKDGEVAVVKITKHGRENNENTEMQMLNSAVRKITEQLVTLDYM